jgi:hypothetical protein
MSNAVFLRPDENGNWGKIELISTAGTEANVSANFADTTSNTTSAMSTGAFLFGYNGTTWDRVRSVNTGQLKTTLYNSSGNELAFLNIATVPDAYNFSTTGIPTVNSVMGFTGTTWDRVRVGKVYKYIEYLNLPTSTSATVWTPSAGKKFRLMGVIITTSASVHLHLRDATTIFHTARCLATGQSFGFGNGYLSAAANNVLEIRNDSGTTTNVWVSAWGTEE